MPVKLHCELRAKIHRVLDKHPQGITVRGICVRTHGRTALVEELVRKVGGVCIGRKGGKSLWTLEHHAITYFAEYGESSHHGNSDRNCYVPTPEQLEAACAEIRSGWTPQEHNRRAPHIAPAAWTVPEYRVVVDEEAA